jgi:hypothetical protein
MVVQEKHFVRREHESDRARTAGEPCGLTEAKKQLWLWVVFGAAVVCGAIWQLYPLKDASDRLSKIPAQGFGFSSQALPLDGDEAKILRRANVVRRRYSLGKNSLVLTVIDGTGDRHAVHDPFYCIRGSGWDIISDNSFNIPHGEARLLRMRKNGRETEALVWFSDGLRRYPSASVYWKQTTLRRVTLGKSGEEPVLVNLQSMDGKPVNWSELVRFYQWLFEF